MINPINTTISKSSKQGGGMYQIIDHVNCDRCEKVIEQREVLSPSKAQRKSGSYYTIYAWCPHCGLYDPKIGTHIKKRVELEVSITHMNGVKHNAKVKCEHCE